MKKMVALFFLLSSPLAAEHFSLQVDAFDTAGNVLPKHAFCVEGGHGKNISPAVKWSGAPKETQSFVFIMHDPDVPTDFSQAGKEGVEIDANQPRQVFYHWVLANIAPTRVALKEGVEGAGVKKNRTKPGKAAHGARGLNDFTKFMKDDAKLAGTYAGFDGPCPPANDARPHRYIFTLYALRVPKLELPKNFTGADVQKALPGKVLAQTSVTGRYTLNKRLMK